MTCQEIKALFGCVSQKKYSQNPVFNLKVRNKSTLFPLLVTHCQQYTATWISGIRKQKSERMVSEMRKTICQTLFSLVKSV